MKRTSAIMVALVSGAVAATTPHHDRVESGDNIGFGGQFSQGSVPAVMVTDENPVWRITT